ncbi:acyl carrier protein [Slackia heliotrinireducens]|uniref:Carrier domain-containing protein n=1 Tax=Slackia heliotrinireducens (strain ATCC 29202 / DSM 20476 / NCTC 11029 / RHS 1) TaxID=471855 RepID=C7N5H0_SLAHD|nr:phosphopantetheine-binding protein [Slackia heliotrinireducens]ACV22155.1 hypothetical protein Shel_11200 [Slackia heliotrinireducens DSM 20476]VEH00212.1 acyl carrier protein [Slackia heliotrinireducens]
MAKLADEVREVIYDATSKTLGVDRDTLTDDTEVIADLGAKSVNLIHIINALEDEFEYQVDFMPFRRQKKISDMIAYVVDLIED